MTEWHLTAQDLPDKAQIQTCVLYGWFSGPIYLGTFDNLGAPRWLRYDQMGDRMLEEPLGVPEIWSYVTAPPPEARGGMHD